MGHNFMPAKTGPAVVVSAGKMMKTVKVRMIKQEWNRRLRKHYARPFNVLVHDPNSSVLTGDIITMAPEAHSKSVRQTVASIVAPFTKPIDQRPPVLSQEQRDEIRHTKRQGKVERRAMRGVPSAIREARLKGWGVGEMYAEAGHVERQKVVEHGREVLPGGVHKFGKINDESREAKRKAMDGESKAEGHERDLESVVQRPDQEVAREDLANK